MTQVVEFTLAPELLVGLGCLSPGAKNRLSPFGSQEAAANGGAYSAALKEKGLLDQFGKPSASVRTVLDGLSSPTAYFQIRLQAGGLFIERVVYRAADGRPILLATVGDEVEVTDPAPLDDVMESVRQMLGDSILRTLDFEADLPWPEALALAALIDLHRKATLRSLVDAGEPSLSFDAATIARASLETDDSTQWLAPMMRLIGETAEAGDMEETLSSLVNGGHVTHDGRAYTLAGPAVAVGGRLLVVEQVLLWGAGRMDPSGSVATVNQLCMQAGVHDLLTVETTTKGVQFASASAALVLDYMRTFLTDPEALAAVEAAPASAPSCRACGATLQEGSRFCNQCGSRVAG